jgi:hypothetical protein
VLDFECVALSLKQSLCVNNDELYEFPDRDKIEEIKEAELEGLDDFLLQNQDNTPASSEDPALLE